MSDDKQTATLRWDVKDIVEACADHMRRQLAYRVGESRPMTIAMLKNIRAAILDNHDEPEQFWVLWSPDRPDGIYIVTIVGLRRKVAEEIARSPVFGFGTKRQVPESSGSCIAMLYERGWRIG